VRCGGCGLHLGYLPNTESGDRRRRDRNPGHRAYWLDRHAGDLVCVLCGARRSQRARVAFDIDHLVPLEDGGPDDEWNTAPLCRDCHTIKGALRALRRHAEGRSARVNEAPLQQKLAGR
jgi:5-methylcytosine-specific restriction endonuclease McrA